MPINLDSLVWRYSHTDPNKVSSDIRATEKLNMIVVDYQCRNLSLDKDMIVDSSRWF